MYDDVTSQYLDTENLVVLEYSETVTTPLAFEDILHANDWNFKTPQNVWYLSKCHRCRQEEQHFHLYRVASSALKVGHLGQVDLGVASLIYMQFIRKWKQVADFIARYKQRLTFSDGIKDYHFLGLFDVSTLQSFKHPPNACKTLTSLTVLLTSVPCFNECTITVHRN